jgi:hypothetical protein
LCCCCCCCCRPQTSSSQQNGFMQVIGFYSNAKLLSYPGWCARQLQPILLLFVP